MRVRRGGKVMKCGARGSKLSVLQAQSALEFLAERVKGFRAKLETFKTPGDRDLATPIEKAAPDFFTRDIDDALRAGAIDFAVHSAKDLPPQMPDDLDWFWLPNHEDPRDCVVSAAPLSPQSSHLRIGVSSGRRKAYAERIYPGARILPMRGTVDDRMRQIAEGKYDLAIMAIAGLNRLGQGEMSRALGGDFKVEPISLEDLPTPEEQGYLAVVFRAGDRRFMEIRRQFAKAVRITSAGVGDPAQITVRGAQDLEEADVVLADALSGFGGGRWRGAAKWVDVGKRCGAHSMEQSEINRLMCDEVRKGRRVVRLKGGDAGLFGRLAEEMSALDALGVPYLVRPGVSALMAATAPNGILLTKRGEANGFNVSTPRSTGTKNPHVFFMSTQLARKVLKGFPPKEKYAMIWDAGGPREHVDLGVCGKPRIRTEDAPGLLVVGYAGEPFVHKRVLLTCSEAVMRDVVCMFEDCGWSPVAWPMVSAEAIERLNPPNSRVDAIVLTSPNAARIFFERWSGDVRKLPAIWTCGPATDGELRKHGVSSDIMPASDFSAKGLMARLRQEGAKMKGLRVLRIRSDKAGRSLAVALRRMGATVEDVVLYKTVPVPHDGTLPHSDAVFFASASAVEFFVARYGAAALIGKEIYVIGEPTRSALPRRFRAKAEIKPLKPIKP